MALTQVQGGMLSAGGVTPTQLSTQSQYTGFKNRIINGAMVIDQRNGGASITPTDGQYSLDRYKFRVSQASKLTAQQNAGSVTPPAGFTNYLGVTSSSAYSIVSGDYFIIVQDIEGFNTTDLNWGSANAKTITLSFWVRSSLTGTFSGAVRNSAANRSYVFSYTINSANTWEYETVTIPGDTTGTWVGATNGIGISVILNLASGSTYSTTAGSWAAGNYTGATGSTSVVGTNGATFYVTGLQFEVGSTATSFDYRPYGTELMLCQRYYQISGVWANYQYMYGSTIAANYGLKNAQFGINMRTSATVVAYSESGVANRFSINRGGAYTAGYITESTGFTMTNGTGGNVNITELTFSWTASAEL